MSTGIDGEDFDLVFSTPKPKVKLPQGSLFICDQETVNGSGSSLNILSQAPGSAGRKLFIAEAVEAIETKITGPGSVSDQILCARVLLRMGAKTVLIDGSLDRKSIALSEVIDHLILAVGAGYGTTESIKEELSRLLLLNTLEENSSLSRTVRNRLLESRDLCQKSKGKWQKTGLKTLLGAEQQYLDILQQSSSSESFIPGAFTESSFSKLKPHLRSTRTSLIFRHPESIKLSLKHLQELLKLSSVQVLIPLKIREYYLNSWSPGMDQRDAESFRQSMRESFPDLQFTDLWELQ
ncbi:MAG TPA: hypothetical protein PLX59_01530 [Candidatus Cloacimonadota bacterium]|nr:hypothetical protein [Candidatus Cloacimonadota bacterium]